MTKSVNTDAIARVTGVEWRQWVAHLDERGGSGLDHTALAAVAERNLPQHMESRAWWSQGVAVAYEQEIGRRQPGQRADGTYAVAVSRTLPSTLDGSLATWMSLIDERASFAGRALADSPTTSSTDKWRRWRANLEGGRVIGAEVGARGDKCVLTVTFSKMESSQEKDSARSFLKDLLAGIE